MYMLLSFLQNVDASLVEVLENNYKRLKLIFLFLAVELSFCVFKQLDTAFPESSLNNNLIEIENQI